MATVANTLLDTLQENLDELRQQEKIPADIADDAQGHLDALKKIQAYLEEPPLD